MSDAARHLMKAGSKISRRQFIAACAASGVFGAYVWTTGCGLRQDFDLIISGGLVFDGTGKEPASLDIGIKKAKITALGDLKGKSAKRIIQAKGLVVAPGFIDIHSHSDDDLLVDGRAQSKIRQGVTTEVVGQDGGSYAPINHDMRERMQERLQKAFGITVDWDDFAGYFRRLRKQGISVNLMSMVGAGTLRAYVMGQENRPATTKELKSMQSLLQTCLKQGAKHLSSGLEYTPGSFASTDELVALTSGLGAKGIYSTHLRNEDDRVLQAVAEAVEIARGGHCALNISHLKASGKRNWNKLDAILQFLNEARQSGLRVTCDRYPYIAYSTGLTSLFPLWSREGPSEKFVERLQNPELIARIQKGVEGKINMLGSWDAVMISSMPEDEHKIYEGKRLGQLAKELGQEPFEFLRQLMIAEKGRGGMVGFAMSEENTKKVLAYPYCAIASDGSARATEGPLSKGNPHPRNFGTFPRVLSHYVRETQTLTLTDAIRKMTSLPADIVGLPDRGRLATQLWADITIFNPETVSDRATFAEPKQYPSGIEFVIVNGEVVLDQGEHTNARPGRIV